MFSWLSQLTYTFLDVRFFYIYYFVLFGIYLYSIVGIASLLFGIRRSKIKHFLFLTFIFFIHSTALRSALAYYVSLDWEYLLEAGVAGQRLLGTVLQPSCFGVFVLLSIEQFLRGKPFRAIIASTIAATVHPTYLLSAAVITASFVDTWVFNCYIEKSVWLCPLATGWVICSIISIVPWLLYLVVVAK